MISVLFLIVAFLVVIFAGILFYILNTPVETRYGHRCEWNNDNWCPQKCSVSHTGRSVFSGYSTCCKTRIKRIKMTNALLSNPRLNKNIRRQSQNAIDRYKKDFPDEYKHFFGGDL